MVYLAQRLIIFCAGLQTLYQLNGKNYSVVMGYVRARLSFAIIRAALLCVRGSRTKWRSLSLADGAAIDETSY